MKQYTLTLTGWAPATTTVVIEAENAEDAIDKAMVLYDEGELDWEIGMTVSDPEIDDISPNDFED